MQAVDTIAIAEEVTSINTEIPIPEFDTKNLLVQPVIFFDTNATASIKIDVQGLNLSIP